MKKFFQHSLAGSAVLFAFSASQAAPAINNGDFETGDFTGWTLTGDTDFNVVTSDAPHTGTYGALFGQQGNAASIVQSIATETGHSYAISFWLGNLGGSINNPATVSDFAVLANNASLLQLSDKSATDYTQYTVSFTASSSSSALAFSLRQDETYWLLDDVTITDTTSPVPEPSAYLMLGMGLGLLALQRRRQ